MSHHINKGILPDQLLGEANDLVQKLTKDQLLWLGGYFSGVGIAGSDLKKEVEHTVVNSETKLEQGSSTSITVLVGSHSGNGKSIARALASTAQANQLKIINMADYKPRNIKKEETLIIIVSTHGEGEPPVDAADLHRFLGSKRVGSLEHLNYAVIALGDSSYNYFCQTGIEFYDRLKSHGAKPLTDTILLDVDYKEHQDEVVTRVLQSVNKASGQSVSSTSIEEKPNVSRDEFYKADLIDKVLLNGRTSNKETYHIELDIEGSGISYQPGDVLEVYAINSEELVQNILNQLGFSGDEEVEHKGSRVCIKKLLQHQKELTLVTLPVLKKLTPYVEEPELNRLLDNRNELENFLDGSDLLDVLKEFNIRLQAQELADALRTLPPRAYSIASSQAEVGDEVHLTVGAVRYQKNERQHEGVCSTYLIDRLAEGDQVAVKVKPNENFRLPDVDQDIILIGAGTGIAPYRSFLQERELQNGNGRTWLFFGDQHFESDFLY
ncbi:MAG: flavodoxin domain-containing protein, partial [Carboxylicivirga sp.]|jgi:sulfite reductase (NADPH) flavoprotein alpha-component|nr:flavodoxin domain-containing protein [Carboxylicivirga sp.]